MSPVRKANDVRRYYRALYRTWGAQHWWPAETSFEVIVGAYLTQNTAWTNVERALGNLRSAQVLSVEGIRHITVAKLERLIRPSGYFRQKARRLKTFVAFLDTKYGGSLDCLFSQPTDKLREELLGLNGVGPETADSILLYAGNHPVFVVDAYTRRILARHEILPEKTDYEDIRNLMQRALAPLAHQEQVRRTGRDSIGFFAPSGSPQGPKPPSFLRPNGTAKTEPQPNSTYVDTTYVDFSKVPNDEGKTEIRGAAHSPSAMSVANRTALVQVYNEMHGLLVGVGKHYCGKSRPKCDGCPLQRFLPCDNP